MHYKINISLPKETIRIIDTVTGKSNRSHFIDEAVQYYIKQKASTNLIKQLKEGAIQRAQRDLALVKE